MTKILITRFQTAMRVCRKSNSIIYAKSWNNFHAGQCVSVKIWTLTGTVTTVHARINQFISATPEDSIKNWTKEYLETRQSNLHCANWLKTSKIGLEIAPFNGRVVISNFKIANVAFENGSLRSKFEINIFLSDKNQDEISDIDSQDDDEIESSDSGWAYIE